MCTDDERARYRREHFAVTLEPIPAIYDPAPGEMRLQVTKNGTQWSEVMTLTPEERDKVWVVLDAERRQRRGGAHE